MNNNKTKILLLEDLSYDVELMKRELEKAGIEHDMRVVDNKKDYIRALHEFSPDIILADHSMPSFNSSEALEIITELGKKIPFILVTGTITEEHALHIISNGASDYILKDRIQRLPSAIKNAIEKHRLETERSEYIEEIIANEALLRETEKLAHIGSWQSNLITGDVKWSDEVYRIFGLQPGEIRPSLESFIRFVHPDYKDFVEYSINQVLKKGEVVKFDYKIIDSNNCLKHIHTELKISRNLDGRPILITGFDQDFTENIIAKELLYKTEQSYKRVVENIIDALLIDDIAGNVIFANDQFLKLFGLSDADLNGLVLENYVAPEFRKQLRERHNQRVAGKDVPDIFEYEGIKKDGARMWLEVRVSKVIENGRIIGTQSAIRDITESKKAQEELLKSQANLKAVFNNTDIAFILTDYNLKIISFNIVAELGFLNILKKPLAEGENIIQFAPDERKEIVTANYARVLNGEHINYEVSLPHPNGALLWYEMRLSPVSGPDNTILGMLMTMTYITDWKNAQLEREKLTNDLIIRNQDLEQFAYIVSHNLRGPVANILGSTNMLSSADLDDDEKQYILNGLTIAINKLDSVIIDLNEILQLKHAARENKEKIIFSDIVSDVVASINNYIQKENVQFETDFTELNELVTVKSYMHSVFYNLITNSIKYRSPDIQPIIIIKSHKLGGVTRLTFSDNGLGFNLKKIGNQIFGLYKKFHFHSDGKGMGLFMVKTQLEALGATIKIESEENKGTRFIIDFKE